MSSPRKGKTCNPKDGRRVKANYKGIKPASANRNRKGLRRNGNGRDVKVRIRLLPETKLLVALANEEVEARRRTGQSEAKIWKDCQRSPLNFVRQGLKKLLSS